MEDDGRAGAAEVLAGEIAAFPDFFAGFAIKSCRSVAAKVNVDVVGIDGGRAGTVAVDVVAERFGIGVLEEKEVVNFLAGGFIEANSIHLFPVGRGVGDPDLVVHDDGSGPGAPGDGGFPDNVLGFAPFGGKAVELAVPAWGIDAIIIRSAEGRPVGERGCDEEEREKKSKSHGLGVCQLGKGHQEGIFPETEESPSNEGLEISMALPLHG